MTSMVPSTPSWRDWPSTARLRLLEHLQALATASAPLPEALQAPLPFLEALQIQDHLGAWLPFRLWDSQRPALQLLSTSRRVVILKARQLGLTWLALGYALWLLRSEPGVTVMMFSVGEREAAELLLRLRGMYEHALPAVRLPGTREGKSEEWRLPNGSRALSFPRTAGVSYTARLALIDEADKGAAASPGAGRGRSLDTVLSNVKPTVDAGGQLFLISTADKSDPESRFKHIYRAAAEGQTDWAHLFLPWSARPERTREWYDRECHDCLANTGSLDHIHGEYPQTAEEALAPRQLDKRFPYAWLQAVFAPLPATPADSITPGLRIFVPPQPGRKYVIGADPAEGNPTSDESAAAVLDAQSGEQVAVLAGRIEPTLFALALGRTADHYHRAAVLVERNNHGHAVLAALHEHCACKRLKGHDDREGWLSSGKGKTLLYDAAADAIREKQVLLHDRTTLL